MRAEDLIKLDIKAGDLTNKTTFYKLRKEYKKSTPKRAELT